MSETIEIVSKKTVYVAWTNTDLTEGRGNSIPLAVAFLPETAARLGKGGSVMGSDCDVRPSLAVQVGGQWLVPGVIEYPSKEDDILRRKREAREAAIEKAKAAGLSAEDIAVLTGGKA